MLRMMKEGSGEGSGSFRYTVLVEKVLCRTVHG